MLRRLVVLVLLLSLSWQALASMGAGALAPDKAEHALLHMLVEAHHHHQADDAYHQDDSSDSIQHIMADACLQAPALLSGVALDMLPLAPAVPAHANVREPLIPHLPGLERPPRLIA